MEGNNNTVEIECSPLIKKLSIVVLGNANTVTMAQTKYAVCGTTLYAENGGIIRIDKDFSSEPQTALVANGGKGRTISVGKDCMFSHGILIRTSDGHKIIDQDSGAFINESKDVVIGNHVWIGARAVILKGSVIDDHSVVGAMTVVTKPFLKKGSVIAGNPAKIISEKKVTWNRDNYV